MRATRYFSARASSLRHTSGFSSLEWIIASMIASIGLLGATQFFSAMRSASVPDKSKRSLASVADELKPRLGRWMEDEWFGIAALNCKASPETMEPLERDGYQLGLFNRDYINTVFPNRRNQEPAHPVRTALESLVATYKEKAADHCPSDPGILSPTITKILGSREAAVSFCRCATAVTAYPTLQGEEINQKDNSGMYACFIMTANAIDISGLAVTVSHNALWLKQNPVLVESFVSISSSATGEPYQCKNLYTGRPSDAVARIDYTFAPVKSAVEQPIGTYGFYFVP